MSQDKFCQDCPQEHSCRQVYRRLGHAACPAIAGPAIRAFLLPLLVFIASLAILEKLFAARGAGILQLFRLSNPSKMHEAQTALSFLMALLITAFAVFLTKVITKKLRKES